MDPRPTLLGFHIVGLATCPYKPNKETCWRWRKEIYCWAWDTLHLKHLWVQTWAICLKRQWLGNRGREVFIVKHFQSHVWLLRGCYAVIFTWQVVYPEDVPVLGVVSLPCHEDTNSSVLPGIQDDCKATAENGLEKRQNIKWRQGFHKRLQEKWQNFNHWRYHILPGKGSSKKFEIRHFKSTSFP
jgi:hypothetical protein